MRHLIDPADFTLEETLSLMDLADRIHEDPAAYRDVAAANAWPLCSMNPAPVPAFPLRLLC